MYDDFKVFYKMEAPSLHYKGKKVDPERLIGEFEKEGYADFEAKPDIPDEASQD